MATAEQIKSLIRAHFSDNETFNTIALQIAAHESKQGNNNLAHAIREIIDKSQTKKKFNDFVISLKPDIPISEIKKVWDMDGGILWLKTGENK